MIDNTIINICGNIGSGKSTVAAMIADWFKVPVVMEETPRISLFDRYCADPRKWAAKTQVQFLLDKFLRIIGHSSSPFVLVDRSSHEDAFIFARAHFDLGNISEEEYTSYLSIYNSTLKFTSANHMNILVKCSRDEQLRRIGFREKREREMLTIGYLDRIAKSYSTFEAELEFDFVLDSENQSATDVLPFLTRIIKATDERRYESDSSQ